MLNPYKTQVLKSCIILLIIFGILTGCLGLFSEKVSPYVSKCCIEMMLQGTGSGKYSYENGGASRSVYDRLLEELPLCRFLSAHAAVIIKEDENAQAGTGDNDETKTSEATVSIYYSYGNVDSDGESANEYGYNENIWDQTEETSPNTVKDTDETDNLQKGENIEIQNNIITVASILKNSDVLKSMTNCWQLAAEYYIVDSSTSLPESVMIPQKLLTKDCSLSSINTEPQILIYHTHATESYSDSRAGYEEDTVTGQGTLLAAALQSRGFSVIHDTTQYDVKNGMDNRSYAYSTARPSITALLEKYPSIEVVIDLHRDSGAKRLTYIDGIATARVMLFNGLSRDRNGWLDDLYNPQLEMNLSFSLQTFLVGREMYGNLMYPIYLKNYRYNMHLMGRYLLIELGTESNTVEEASNAIEPLADILNQVLRYH